MLLDVADLLQTDFQTESRQSATVCSFSKTTALHYVQNLEWNCAYYITKNQENVTFRNVKALKCTVV